MIRSLVIKEDNTMKLPGNGLNSSAINLKKPFVS